MLVKQSANSIGAVPYQATPPYKLKALVHTASMTAMAKWVLNTLCGASRTHITGNTWRTHGRSAGSTQGESPQLLIGTKAALERRKPCDTQHSGPRLHGHDHKEATSDVKHESDSAALLQWHSKPVRV